MLRTASRRDDAHLVRVPKLHRWIADGVGGPLPSYAFRGQANSEWTLQPSFTRLVLSTGLSSQEALSVETAALKDFQTVAHMHSPTR
jgi:hypothetical protein